MYVCSYTCTYQLVQVAYAAIHGVEVDPDSRDANTNQEGREVTKKFISEYLTGVSTTPSIVEPCIVAVSLYCTIVTIPSSSSYYCTYNLYS